MVSRHAGSARFWDLMDGATSSGTTMQYTTWIVLGYIKGSVGHRKLTEAVKKGTQIIARS